MPRDGDIRRDPPRLVPLATRDTFSSRVPTVVLAFTWLVFWKGRDRATFQLNYPQNLKLAINLRTELDLNGPPQLLARADAVIE